MKKDRVNKIKFTIFIIFILAALIFIGANWHLIRNIKMHSIVKFAKDKGPLSIILYLLIYVIKPFLIVIPSNVIAIGGGVLFGPIRSFLLTMIGFWISGTIAFYIARFLGKDFVESIIGDKLMKLDNNMEKKGFKILFLLRLPPILPYDPLSYACGLTKIKYKDFIFASLLGVVPETLCYSIIGRQAHNPKSPMFIIPILILILGVVLSKFIMNKRHEAK